MAKKKQKKQEKPYRIHKLYEVKEGSIQRKTKPCPKCGPGVFMAKHKDRYHCGKCGYTEFVNV